MRATPVLAALAFAFTLGAGGLAPAHAEEPTDQPAVVEGRVTKIDLERRRVTLRSSDGKTHEFEASPETLKDLEVGDRIEAKRRSATN